MLFKDASYIINRLTASTVPDAVLPTLRYATTHKKLPNLKAPRSLSEKVLYSFIHHREPVRHIFADKIATRDYVAEHAPEVRLPALYGIYTRFEDIDFSELPERYVVKGAHGSGYIHLVSDARKLDKAKLRADCDYWMAHDYYFFRREWFYRDLPRRIMIEEFLYGKDGDVPEDYKIWVANGKALFIVVDVGRFRHHQRAHYSPIWERLPFSYLKKDFVGALPRPAPLETMVRAAEKLAAEVQLARVDFYVIGDTFYLGEITNSPEGGNAPITPVEWNLRLGDQFGPCTPPEPSA